MCARTFEKSPLRPDHKCELSPPVRFDVAQLSDQFNGITPAKAPWKAPGQKASQQQFMFVIEMLVHLSLLFLFLVSAASQVHDFCSKSGKLSGWSEATNNFYLSESAVRAMTKPPHWISYSTRENLRSRPNSMLPEAQACSDPNLGGFLP